jgi:uncharacterized protein YjbI with pentapeptide repeats
LPEINENHKYRQEQSSCYIMNVDVIRSVIHVLNVCKGVLPNFTELIENDEIDKDLVRAGGLISLLGIGLKLYYNKRKKSRSITEEIFDSLVETIFSATQDALRNISRKHLDSSEIKLDLDIGTKKELVSELFRSFEEESSGFFGSLISHPVIRKFKSLILMQLEIKYATNDALTSSFEREFDLILLLRIEEDSRLTKLNQITSERNSLEMYLRHLEAGFQTNEFSDLGKGSSGDNYYIEEREATLANTTAWDFTDDEIRFEYRSDITLVENIIKDFLDKPMRRYLFIGAPFGIGKTSLVKNITSKYASTYLKGKTPHIPVVVFLRKGLDYVYEDYDLDYVLNNSTGEERFDKQILLILDGLDEYQLDVNILVRDKVRKDLNKYRNMKIIMTTRLKAGFPVDLSINERYVRLLSLNIQQVNALFDHYGLDITYNNALGLGLRREEISNPLLAWMLSKIFPLLRNDLHDIESEEKLTGSMSKSLIYLNFFHYILTGRYVGAHEKHEIQRKYISEKKTLRIIALLKQVHKESLTERNIESEHRLFGSAADLSNLQQVLTAYFYLRARRGGERIIDFLHETFKEYLMAENYLEGLLKHKTHLLKSGSPAKETIEFLEGLIELLNSENNSIKKFIEYNADNEISLFNSFEYQGSRENAKQEIINNCIQCINDDSVTLFNTQIEENNWIYAEDDIASNDFKNLWIHRWISLFVLTILHYPSLSGKHTKDKLSHLIRESSRITPYYIKRLNKVDLSGANLSHADLSNADLSGANLSHADLSYSNLIAVNLSGVNLSYTDLSNANLSHSHLSSANLI